jgi:branched-subunit amino acid aminotransferase/4-amino-4-deoxychorismate lyase
LDEIRVPGITVIEKTLLPQDLERAGQVFITSTTRDLMPVSYIEGLKVKSEGLELVEQLAQAFAKYRDAYVKRNVAASRDKITM